MFHISAMYTFHCNMYVKLIYNVMYDYCTFAYKICVELHTNTYIYVYYVSFYTPSFPCNLPQFVNVFGLHTLIVQYLKHEHCGLVHGYCPELSHDKI